MCQAVPTAPETEYALSSVAQFSFLDQNLNPVSATVRASRPIMRYSVPFLLARPAGSYAHGLFDNRSLHPTGPRKGEEHFPVPHLGQRPVASAGPPGSILRALSGYALALGARIAFVGSRRGRHPTSLRFTEAWKRRFFRRFSGRPESLHSLHAG